jgi:hypothetical protein
MPRRAAALFGLAHLDGKIIAGLERVIDPDTPTVRSYRPARIKYITWRSRKPTARVICEQN